MRTRTFLQTLGLAITSATQPSFGQSTSSTRPIRVIVPLPAGTSTDAITRAIMQSVSQILGQPIVVENKPGASGVIGAMEVVRASPDGLTLLSGPLSVLATNVAFVKNLPYDPRRHFTPIANATAANHVFMVAADSPHRTFADFIAHAKKNPGKVNIGSSTSFVQLIIATLNKVASVQMVPVPYKGIPATLTDVTGHVLDATLVDPVNALAQTKAGYMRALVVMTAKRNQTMPDCPPITDMYPSIDFTTWNAFAGPAGMQPQEIKRISSAIGEALQQAELVKKLSIIGMPIAYMDPEQLKNFIASETEKYIRLAKEANISSE